MGVIIAAASSFAPAVLPVTLMCAVAIAIGSVLVGSAAQAVRLVRRALEAVIVALVLSLPWVVGVALAGKGAPAIFGLPISATAAPGWGEILRFATGPAARSPLVWAVVGAAVLPLLLGTGSRLVWAGRLWTMACASWVLAYAATHGWTSSFAPSESVVLVPAAIAVAACIGLGIASFEHDVVGQSFGWRQAASAVALIALTLGLLPVVAGALNGRWDLPTSGAEQPLAFMARPGTDGLSRVLWLGDPRALPVGGWTVQPGLSYALTAEALPTTTDVWTPAGPGPAQKVAQAVHLAVTGGTIHLGRLLSAAGVRYVVVVDGLAPAGPALASSVDAPPPPGLQRALLNQNDLVTVPGEFGVQVYRNTEFIPLSAQRTAPAAGRVAPQLLWPEVTDVENWAPVLAPLNARHGATGQLSRGSVFAG